VVHMMSTCALLPACFVCVCCNLYPSPAPHHLPPPCPPCLQLWRMSQDAPVAVFNFTREQEVFNMRWSPAPAAAAAAAPDGHGQLVATASLDNAVHILDAQSGRCEQQQCVRHTYAHRAVLVLAEQRYHTHSRW
jgi:hypothetical protein